MPIGDVQPGSERVARQPRVRPSARPDQIEHEQLVSLDWATGRLPHHAVLLPGSGERMLVVTGLAARFELLWSTSLPSR